MSRAKRLIALAACLVVVLAAVFGIAYWSASYDPDNPDPGLYVDGRRIKDPGSIITLGSNNVSYDEYRFQYYSSKDYIDMMYYYQEGATPDWENDPDGDLAYMLQSYTDQYLVYQYAWLDLANEMGITLTDEEKQEIQQSIIDARAEQGDEAYDAWLVSYHYDDDEFYTFVQEQQKLLSKAQEAVREQIRSENEGAGDDAVATYIADYISAKHILFMLKTDEQYEADRAAAEAGTEAEAITEYFDDDGEALTEEQIAEKAKADTLARAEALVADILADEDPVAAFDAAMNELSEDGGLASNPDGYTFTEGEMVDIFYQTALALDDYEISEPVLSESSNYSGYHIIMRIPLSQEAIETARTTAVENKVTELFNEKQTEMMDAMEVLYGEYYDDIKLQNMV